jgi:hypothetical protein
MRAFCGALVLCTALGPVAGALRAEEATPQGAARLTETLQTYLGRSPGVVTVTAEGAGYAVRLDPTPVLSALQDGAGSLRMTPLVADLTNRGDGTWDVVMDQAFSLSLEVAGEVTGPSSFEVAVEKIRMTGVFDESLRSMRRSVTDMAGLSVVQITALPDQGEATSRQAVATLRVETDAAAGGGGVDLTTATAMTGLSQVQTLPLEQGGAPLELRSTAARYQADGVVRGLRTAAVLDTLAWLVAHPSAGEIVAGQEELRGHLTAALPLMDGATSTSEVVFLELDSPVGTFALSRVTTASELSGIVAEGRFRSAGTLEGLELPSEMVPYWATGLVPQSLSLDLSVTGFDLAAPAAILIGTFDLTAPEPLDDAITAPLLAALLPRGGVQLALAPGQLTAPQFELGFGGDLSLGPGTVPDGKARVTLRGYEDINEALDAAPRQEVEQFRQGLGMAWGLAEKGDGLLTWDFRLTADGRVMLNGMDMGPILGEGAGAAP